MSDQPIKIRGVSPYCHWSQTPECVDPKFNPSEQELVDLGVIETTGYGGTYGMGGPGFVRLDLSNGMALVVCVWAATGWMTLNGNLIEDNDDSEALSSIEGFKIQAYDCKEKSLVILLGDETKSFTLSIDENPSKRPVWRGTGEPKIITGDLRKGVIYFSSKFITQI